VSAGRARCRRAGQGRCRTSRPSWPTTRPSDVSSRRSRRTLSECHPTLCAGRLNGSASSWVGGSFPRGLRHAGRPGADRIARGPIPRIEPDEAADDGSRGRRPLRTRQPLSMIDLGGERSPLIGLGISPAGCSNSGPARTATRPDRPHQGQFGAAVADRRSGPMSRQGRKPRPADGGRTSIAVSPHSPLSPILPSRGSASWATRPTLPFRRQIENRRITPSYWPVGREREGTPPTGR
jgi:hypothetical protein